MHEGVCRKCYNYKSCTNSLFLSFTVLLTLNWKDSLENGILHAATFLQLLVVADTEPVSRGGVSPQHIQSYLEMWAPDIQATLKSPKV